MIRRAPLAALGAALACAPTGDVRVLADTSAGPGAVEVAGVRADPRSSAQRLADSLAAQFEKARAGLNARAESLAATDRRSPEYAAAYARYSVSAAQGESLRAARDRARLAAQPRPALQSALPSEVVRARCVSGGADLRLRAGEWWVVWMDSAGGVITAKNVTVRSGIIDTVRQSEVRSQKWVTSDK